MRRKHEDEDTREYYGQLTTIFCPEEEDKTRQEDKAETDINRILQRFGVGQMPQLRQASYGELDYTIDLQIALEATAAAKRGWAALPPQLKRKYPNYLHLLNALESGQVTPEEIAGKATEAGPGGSKTNAATAEKPPLTN